MLGEDFGKAEIEAIESASKRVENMLKVSIKTLLKREVL